MIPINEIKKGDYVIAEFEGSRRQGQVNDVNRADKRICVETEVQEFWYDPENLYPIPISDEELIKLNFSKEEMPDGVIKYKKGSFRLIIPKANDFSAIEMWYREDLRDNPNVHYIHQLQNHYHQMTKVHLTNAVIA